MPTEQLIYMPSNVIGVPPQAVHDAASVIGVEEGTCPHSCHCSDPVHPVAVRVALLPLQIKEVVRFGAGFIVKL